MSNRFVKEKRDRSWFRRILLPTAMFAVVLALFLYGAGQLNAAVQREQLSSAQRAVTRAAVQCYAAEGFYPATTDYLVERYGLCVDESKYRIDYQCFASNLMPDITVVPIQ